MKIRNRGDENQKQGESFKDLREKEIMRISSAEKTAAPPHAGGKNTLRFQVSQKIKKQNEKKKKKLK